MDRKPGKFYLGRAYDLEAGSLLDEPVFYDADDLTTHAVCIGMTGSGKTGLGIGLLEEAILQRIPLLIVDPKGDVVNLLLQFPDLAPEEFRPWVDPAEAQRDGLSVEAYAAQVAGRWRKGLADWGLGPEDVRRLREAAEYTLYTPGSDAGVPVSVLQSFRAPREGWEATGEEAREQVTQLVSALLGLVGVEADPLRSREHILLSNLVEHAWREGRDLDLPALIQGVQKPPFRKLGVFDVDAFFPPNDRFQLAMLLNSLIAAPAFRAWTEGAPLDIQGFLWGPDGRPRVSLFYLAHLSDAERMFFVTLLLEAVRAWLRGQSGSPTLRAILYFDELFGFFPPHPANPPSKAPLMALLKQARAYGLGLMLTTQNPVDLDYKGLTNAGTWFIGTLQAARDKERLLDGLESVASGLSRSYLDRTLSSLRKRVFLLHNVHEKAPITFQTRWVMSYLRGPLTRDQVRTLRGAVPGPRPEVHAAEPAPAAVLSLEGLSSAPPALLPEVPQYFLEANTALDQALRAWQEAQGRQVEVLETRTLYRPALLGLGAVSDEDVATGVRHRVQTALLLWGAEGGRASWGSAEAWPLSEAALKGAPAKDALYEPVPEAFNEPKELRALERAFADHLYRTARLEVFYNPVLKVYGRPGESEREFRQRCEEAARKARDGELEKVQAKYRARRENLERDLQKRELDLAERKAEYEARKREELLSAGESVLGMFLGRRSTRPISTASRRRRLTEKARMDVEEAEEKIKALKEDLEEVEKEKAEALKEVRDRWAEVLDEVQVVAIKPLKGNVRALTFGLAWVPHWLVAYRDARTGSTASAVLSAHTSGQE
ncbi:MAG: helicase HerA domain-containing protein [Anaerolineae bacterium]